MTTGAVRNLERLDAGMSIDFMAGGPGRLTRGSLGIMCHPGKIDVRPGDMLQTVGRRDAMGATGPQPHWDMMLNSATVDPALLLAA